MNNPWSDIKAFEYEGHMKFVKQHDLLNQIFKDQISKHFYKTIGILGIGCGNGLEAIPPNTTVYGYDVNRDFLDVCRCSYKNSHLKLILQEVDLTDKNATINLCDFLVANLVVEYIGKYNFARIVNKSKPDFLSVVLQITLDEEKAISDSPFVNIMKNILPIRSEVTPQDLTSTLELIGYKLEYSKTYEINHFKSFIRMDFSIVNKMNQGLS